MNYGYEPTKKDAELASALKQYIDTLPIDARGQKPYIEVHRGVRIRRITHYDDSMIEKIVKDCDEIYKKIVD